MINALLPAFDVRAVFVEPWVDDPGGSLMVVLMGFFVCAACGLVGSFLMLRRMALMGDAISHSVLPGIALAFLLSGTRDTLPMFAGALAAGVVTVVLIEWIHKSTRVKPDAAMGIVFSALFAIGVIVITRHAGHVDLDADCVLYGELLYVTLEEPVFAGSVFIGTVPLVRMAVVFFVVAALVRVFFRGLQVTTFDPGLARSLGLPVRAYHLALMVALAIVVVSAFESVGAILVVGMLVFPGATALLLFERLQHVLVGAVSFALVYALAGFHLDAWLNATIAGSMTLVATALFVAVWITRLLVRRVRRRAP